MSHQVSQTDEGAPSGGGADPLAAIWENIKSCMQCGTCTGSCPNAHAMDYTPRQLWRMVQLGLKEEILNSHTFWLCSSCYFCTLRCPRGLPLTETIGALKRMAMADLVSRERRSSLFYLKFMDTVRRYGRVREMELMTRYFLALRNPLVPFQFTPLGLKLMAKGKLSPRMPKFLGEGKLDAIYRRVQELEGRP
jgi:heterodisulfide reductase subunit C